MTPPSVPSTKSVGPSDQETGGGVKFSPKSFVLVGAPDDRGVAINNGRIGAKGGPDAIRAALNKMDLPCPLSDAGDIDCGGSQDETYARLNRTVADILSQGAFPIVLGGGHDLSFGSLSAFVRRFPGGGIINIDPHIDCRPVQFPGRYSSGTPFQRLMEEGGLDGKNLCAFGFRDDCNVEEYIDYAKSRNVKLVKWPGDFQKTLADFSKDKAALAISFDMDSVNAAFAPGVSAANPQGFTAVEALEMVQVAARQKNLKMFEIMEVNPLHDPDQRTVKLAAHLIHEVLNVNLLD